MDRLLPLVGSSMTNCKPQVHKPTRSTRLRFGLLYYTNGIKTPSPNVMKVTITPSANLICLIINSHSHRHLPQGTLVPSLSPITCSISLDSSNPQSISSIPLICSGICGGESGALCNLDKLSENYDLEKDAL